MVVVLPPCCLLDMTLFPILLRSYSRQSSQRADQVRLGYCSDPRVRVWRCRVSYTPIHSTPHKQTYASCRAHFAFFLCMRFFFLLSFPFSNSGSLCISLSLSLSGSLSLFLLTWKKEKKGKKRKKILACLLLLILHHLSAGPPSGCEILNSSREATNFSSITSHISSRSWRPFRKTSNTLTLSDFYFVSVCVSSSGIDRFTYPRFGFANS